MSKIVLKSLSTLLGAFFIFLGALKITPKVSRDLHKDLRSEYVKYAKVFPLSKTLHFRLPSKVYRRVVGGIEIVTGLLLLSPFPRNRKVKNFANILLLLLKTLNVYSHWMISDEFERTAPSLVFFLLLSCRLVVDWQLSREGKYKTELQKQLIQDDEGWKRANYNKSDEASSDSDSHKKEQ